MSRDDKEREPSASDKRWMPLPWSVERTCSQSQASSLTARGDSYMDLLFTWKPVMMQTSSLWLATGTASITGKTTFSFSICYRIIFSDIRSALSTEWHRWEVEEGESQKPGHTEEWMLMVRLASLWIYTQGSCRSWTFCIHFRIHRHNKKWVSYSQGFRTWTASRSVNYVFVSGVAL